MLHGPGRVTGERTLRKPYSVSATKAMGTVEMKQPAMGMKEQMNTNRLSRPRPGMASIHMPAAVSAVLTKAICACAGQKQGVFVDEHLPNFQPLERARNEPRRHSYAAGCSCTIVIGISVFQGDVCPAVQKRW